jgi:hypothetical protein
MSNLLPSEQLKKLGTIPEPRHKKPMLPAFPKSTVVLNSNFSSAAQPVPNQSNCGCCTGEGCCNVVQAQLKLLFGLSVQLSVQMAFECSGGTCANGNTVTAVLDYMVSNGVALEADCPFNLGSGNDIACGVGLATDWWTRGYKIASYTALTTLDDIRTALVSQPLVTTMAVYQDFFNYSSGVYVASTDPSNTLAGYHCIGCFGGNDATKAYLAENSWGPEWGESGWFWISYDTSMCQFDAEMYSVVPSTTPIPNPNPNPNPTPTPTPLCCKKMSEVLKIWRSK